MEGMLAYWVRKGRLCEKEEPLETGAANCASGSCGSTCAGLDNCAYVARMPKVYSLAQAAKPNAISGQEDDLAAKKG